MNQVQQIELIVEETLNALQKRFPSVTFNLGVEAIGLNSKDIIERARVRDYNVTNKRVTKATKVSFHNGVQAITVEGMPSDELHQ